MRTKIALALFVLFGLLNCSDDETTFDLKGKWIDTESFGLQFIEFQSKNKGRFGIYSKNHEQFENFTYRIFDNKIAIDFIGDGDAFFDRVKQFDINDGAGRHGSNGSAFFNQQ